ncbi:hypothetical protein HZS_2916 [Henneguya salminicola]|nr:hypothetical protein HZS_2916 [Henneguya salminicola]
MDSISDTIPRSLVDSIESTCFIQTKDNLSVHDRCKQCFCSLDLIKNIPSLRSSLQENIWSIFESYIDIYLSNYDKKYKNTTGNNSQFSETLLSAINLAISDIKNTISKCTEFWGPYFFEWIIQFMSKMPLLFPESSLRGLSLDEMLHFFKDCPAIKELNDLIKYILENILINGDSSEISCIFLSNIISYYPMSTWIFVLCMQYIPPDALYKSLLQFSLTAFSSKFQSVHDMIELFSISLEYFPKYKDALITSCFKIFDESLNEPLSQNSLNTVPFLLHFLSFLQPYFDHALLDVLNKLDSKTEKILSNQCKYREENLQLCLLPKIANLIAGFPSHDLSILKYILNSSSADKPYRGAYLYLLCLLTDKTKEIMILNNGEIISHTAHILSFNILQRLQPNISELLDLLIQYRTSAMSIILFCLIVAIGLSGGPYQMSEILILILSEKTFTSQHHYLLIEFSGSFQTTHASLSKFTLKQIALNYDFFVDNQFEIIINNLKTVMQAERRYMGNKFSPHSYRFGFMSRFYHYFSLIPKLKSNELLSLLEFFDIFDVITFKNLKTIEQSFDCFRVVIHLVTFILSDPNCILIYLNTSSRF